MIELFYNLFTWIKKSTPLPTVPAIETFNWQQVLNEAAQRYPGSEFLEFLNFFTPHWQKDQNKLHELYTTLILYNIAKLNGPTRNIKISQLFARSFAQDPQQTISFFYKQPFFKKEKIASITALVNEYEAANKNESSTNLNKMINYFNYLFQYEDNPQQLRSLFKKFHADPIQFAALILWFLYHKHNEDQIISSRIIHEFIYTHLPELASNNNSVQKMYHLLLQDPIAKNLIKKVKKTVCTIPGFQTYKKKYSLYGEEQESHLLKITQLQPQTFNLSLTKQNFERLYQEFDIEFLLQCFITNARHPHPILNTFLSKLINEEWQSFPLTHLASLLHTILKQQDPTLNQYLADLIDEHKITDLFFHYPQLLLSLSPYKCFLFFLLNGNLNEIDNYLKQLSEQEPAERLIQLRTLLNQIITHAHNYDLEEKVYEKLLQIMLHYPFLQEDGQTISYLIPYTSRYFRVFRTVATKLAEDVDRSINLLNVHSFNEGTIQSLQNLWAYNKTQFSFLKKLEPPYELLYPEKIESFLAMITNKIANNQLQDGVNLSTLIHQLLCYSKLNESLFKPILLEFILITTHPQLLINAISILENSSDHWLTDKYGNHSLLELAAAKGNLKLLKVLLKKYPFKLSEEIISDTFIQASTAKQVGVIHFLSRHLAQVNERTYAKVLLNVIHNKSVLFELLEIIIKMQPEKQAYIFKACDENNNNTLMLIACSSNPYYIHKCLTAIANLKNIRLSDFLNRNKEGWNLLMMLAYHQATGLLTLLKIIEKLPNQTERKNILCQTQEEVHPLMMLTSQYSNIFNFFISLILKQEDQELTSTIMKRQAPCRTNLLMYALHHHPNSIDLILKGIEGLKKETKDQIYKQTNLEGHNALMIASLLGCNEVIKKLLGKVPPVSDNFNDNPVFLAAIAKKFSTVQLLLEYDLSRNITYKTTKGALLKMGSVYSEHQQQALKTWITDTRTIDGYILISPFVLLSFFGDTSHINLSLQQKRTFFNSTIITIEDDNEISSLSGYSCTKRCSIF